VLPQFPPPPAREPRLVSRTSTTGFRLLWIDDHLRQDDPTIRLLRAAGVVVEIAVTAADGLAKAASRSFDAILLDVNLPDMYGVTALRRLRALGLDIPIFMITGCYFEPEVEAEARAVGATDFVHKPVFDVEQLADALRSAAAAPPAAETAQDPDAEYGIIAASSVMRDVQAWVKRVAPGKMSVLLTGETGTGKELVARAIHAASGRQGRFVAVNCGAITETLVESELFGHVRGAFTSADRAKPGLVEEAHGGTLFLDEVGEMPLPQQVRLLRFLDRGEVRRVGETRDRIVDVRVVTATNRDLRDQVARGRFRQDFYYRLATMTYSLPALRDRPDDIEPLTRHWLEHLRREDGRLVTASPAALDVLRAHPWPGNVRELRSVLERAKTIAAGQVLTDRKILESLGRTMPSDIAHSADDKRRRAEASLLANRWNAKQAAKSLGISRTTLYRWLGATVRKVARGG
jgi:two-component system, NtrC family, response regulator HydG